MNDRARLLLKVTAAGAIVGASLIAAAKGHAADAASTTHSGAAAGAAEIQGVHADVRVRVIHAKTANKHFDTHLEDLRKYLEKFKYSSYREVIDDTMHLQVASQQSISLLSGKTLSAQLISLSKDKATIRFILNGQSGQMLDTTVGVGPDRTFFIAGPRYDDGILFMAIIPHYDPDDVGNVPGVVHADAPDTGTH